MTNDQSKLVSVILPVYNNELYIRDAIQSVLDQTYNNIEVILLISAATNKESLEVMDSFTDSRIRRIYREHGVNLPMALNIGIKESKGEYIARMDSDDICLPKRFEEQIKFLESHPDIGLCGTWFESFGHGKPFKNKLYTDPEDIKANLLFYSSFAHSSVMFRKEALDKSGLRYNESINCSEDYDLWSRCVEKFLMANIGKVLLRYRVHPQGATQVRRQETLDLSRKIRLELLRRIGLKPTAEEAYAHNSKRPENGEPIMTFLTNKESWLLKILEANAKKHIYREESLDKIIYERWRMVCGLNSPDIETWKLFTSSKIFKLGPKNRYTDSLKMLLKCLLKR